MEQQSARPADSVEEVLERYGDMLYRVCLVNLKNPADAEDAVQETLIKYLCKAPRFQNGEHQKAWLIRVAVNQCRDFLRRRCREELPLEDAADQAPESEQSPVLEALLTLPEKFRTALTLHYVEGFSVAEIGKITGTGASAVKMRLQKGRRLLEEAMRKES